MAFLSLVADCSSTSMDGDTDGSDDAFESDSDCDINGGFVTEELTLGPGLRVHVMSPSESAFNYDEIFKQVAREPQPSSHKHTSTRA